MPLTPKQEKFAQKYIELGNASEAYRQSYDVAIDCQPETIWCNASQLLSDTKVSQRVKELQQLAQNMHLVTVGTITAELEEARGIAAIEKQAAPMISASMGKAKLHGLVSDKTEITGKDGAPLIPEENPVETAKRLAFILAQGRAEMEKDK